MGWLDAVFGAVLAAFGLALVVVLLVGGGTVVGIALVIGVFAVGTAWWLYTSWGWETLRRRK